jgi:hypothetical protein
MKPIEEALVALSAWMASQEEPYVVTARFFIKL